jgi:hypothetical protein
MLYNHTTNRISTRQYLPCYYPFLGKSAEEAAAGYSPNTAQRMLTDAAVMRISIPARPGRYWMI